jgi:hypothetical protein
MRRLWWVSVALTAAVPAAAAQQARRTVVVDFTSLPSGFSEFGAARARFDSLVAERLRDAGFAVVPAESSEAVWKRNVDSVGGLYDTYSGKLIRGKFVAVRAGTLRELQARFRADAWLHPMIEVRVASFDGSQVDWDGAREASGASGGVVKLLFGSDQGTTQALSLVVEVETIDGKTFYTRAGGIQLLKKVYREGLLPVPRASLFADTSRTAAAVHIALDAFTPAVLDSIH